MQNKTQTSKVRKTYFVRLFGRIVVFLLAILLYIVNKREYEILSGWNFFGGFSVLHILWAVWIIDMVLQLIPVRAHISIGSQKVFSSLFRPIKEKINKENLKKYIIDTTKAASKVLILWTALIVVIGILYWKNILDVPEIFLISVFFYVADLICVLIWCPFRLIMGNKCCTTCRIFNWDHLMMFSPFLIVPGVYSYSLAGLAIAVFLVWEVCVFTYPERFWENSNMALKCSECTDKLCTQYCRKLGR